jgi:hypothetical protein
MLDWLIIDKIDNWHVDKIPTKSGKIKLTIHEKHNYKFNQEMENQPTN